MRPKLDPIHDDAAIAALASRQQGVVTLLQLLELGLSREAVKRRVRAGRLHRIHRGVYAVGHPGLSADGLRLAAVLACGPGAALSHHSAAGELGVRPRRGGLVHVTVPSRNGRTAPRGVGLHRVHHLPDDQVITRGALRLTSAARTFVDCAPDLHDREVQRMLDAAWPRGHIVWDEIERALAAPRPGVGRMRRVLNHHTPGSTTTRTRPEERLRRLVLRSPLPSPETNVAMGPWEADLLWRAQRLVVEVDSSGYHGSPWAKERDARKDAWLSGRGFRVLRIPSPLVRSEPDQALALIAQALGLRIGSS